MIYLDYNASTPVDPQVKAIMQQASDLFSNPSSTQHVGGQRAGEVIEEARHQVAASLNRTSRDVVFTSGASEAATIGILGAMLGSRHRPNVVIAATEHKAIAHAATVGARLTGGEVRVAPVDRSGVVDLSQLADIVDSSVSVVALMAANNETGVIGPTAEASILAHDHDALFFCDVTQLLGKAPADEVSSHADLMVCSSHKLYGPKGAGALIASRHVQKDLFPVLGGGGQEFGLRGGTQNTVALAGFGFAAQLATERLSDTTQRLAALRNELLAGLEQCVGRIEVNGRDAPLVCNTLNIRIVGADSEAVMSSMPDVAASAGSACQAAVPTPSHVLLAMGRTSIEAAESLRLSVGTPTTQVEIQNSIDKISGAALRVRELTSDSERFDYGA